MAPKKGIEGIREYFTDEEWSNMPDTTKKRYVNLKENYDLMVKLGLRPQALSFMKPPTKPAIEKEDRDAVSSVAAESVHMELGRGPAVGTGCSKFVKDHSLTHLENAALAQLFMPAEKHQGPSQKASRSSSHINGLNKASLSQSSTSAPLHGHAYHQRFELTSDDDALYCDDCQISYPGDCPRHGPLIYIKDTPVPDGDALRAKKSLPVGLAIRRTTIRGTAYGVYAVKPLSKRVCFGPYEGEVADMSPAGLSSKRCERVERSADSLILGRSNWMRYVNRSTGAAQHNLVAFKRAGALYYRTCRAIGAYEELLVSFNTPETVQQENAYVGVPVVKLERIQEDSEIASRDTISCEVCGDCFASYEYFLRHKLRKHAERPPGKYKCSHCDYSTNTKFLKAQHEWSHTGDKPFSCGMCDRSFAWKSSLHDHLTSHTREKPFECAECGERFTCSSHMLRHQNAHSKDARPFVCPICKKSYARRDYVKIHIHTHTSEKQHSCRVCGRRFTDRSNAKRHEMTVHAKQFPLSCPYCDKGFASRREVRRHVLTHHEREREP